MTSSGNDAPDNLCKIKQLYKSAFALTNGRPSDDLLCALSEQAQQDGVYVSGKEIEKMEYEELIFQKKSKEKRVRSIRGNSKTSIGILNTYLDMYLNHNQLDKFEDTLFNCREIPLTAVDQSLILRYVLECKKVNAAPKVKLSHTMQTISTLMGLFYEDMLYPNDLSDEVDQNFVNDVIEEYSWSPTDFEDFKRVVYTIDPSITFSTTSQRFDTDYLKQIYPVTYELYSKPDRSKRFKMIKPSPSCLIDQLKNETNDFTQIKSISQEQKPNPEVWKYKSKLQNSWENILYKALVHESNMFKRGNHKDYRLAYCPILDDNVMCLKTVAKATINYICEELITEYEGIEVLKSASAIGEIVHRIYCKQATDSGVVIDEYNNYMNNISNDKSPQNAWEAVNKQEYTKFKPYWNHSVMQGVGGFLLNLVRLNLKFNEQECAAVLRSREPPAAEACEPDEAVFEHTYFISNKMNHNHPVGTFKTSPSIKQLMLHNMQSRGYFYFESTEVPMLCPPTPWISASSTPMLSCHVPIIRFAGFDWKNYFANILEEYDRQGHLDTVKYALDVLGLIPWTVNKLILQKQIQVFNSGGMEKLSIACKFDKEYPKELSDPSEEELKEYRKTVRELKKEQDEKFAIRCTQLYTLSLANNLAQHPAFWQCYNLDFRGRTYPVAPHLSHMLGDPARGMLLFADGAPLGPKGLRWLKIHCVNKFGAISKASFDEKERYADDHLDLILDSADHMCTEKGWWSQSTEDPWQCLATCIEIARAVRSGDPAQHVCNLPVHMDGSCNGLQHYAALGRDVVGALKVNVVASPAPEDVYMAVMNIVMKLQEEDAKKGNKVAQKLEGDWIKRKTLKQTVMTQVYGVTQYGAKDQIQGKLIDQGMSREDATTCAQYLAGLTFAAVGQLFTQAQKIQAWFNKSADEIAKSGKPVQWVTPLGLPCVQPYTKDKRYVTYTPFQTLNMNYPSPEMPVNRSKQKTAFPPNFVHSQDSTHLMMTAIKCYQLGIPFAAVHDSFWTLPCHVDHMNEILRQQFVIMYSYDVLKNLKESFQKMYPDVEFSRLPAQGELDINCVKDSDYFFS